MYYVKKVKTFQLLDKHRIFLAKNWVGSGAGLITVTIDDITVGSTFMLSIQDLFVTY